MLEFIGTWYGKVTTKGTTVSEMGNAWSRGVADGSAEVLQDRIDNSAEIKAEAKAIATKRAAVAALKVILAKEAKAEAKEAKKEKTSMKGVSKADLLAMIK
jgi:hypothetical protein